LWREPFRIKSRRNVCICTFHFILDLNLRLHLQS
jgi:hypothetical protein